MHWQSDRLTLVGQSTLDRLFDPPRCTCSASLLRRIEALTALVNHVASESGQAAADRDWRNVRNGYNEPQIQRIIRSRFGVSFLIFAAISTLLRRQKEFARCLAGICSVRIAFITATYPPERILRYCARVGFFGATYELVAATSLEIKIVTLPMRTGNEDDSFMKLWAWDVKNLPSITHAIRTAVAATMSVIIARLVQMPEAYWAAIATLVVMQSTLGATLTLSIERIVATAVGASVAAIETNYFRANLVAFAICFLVGLLSIAFRLQNRISLREHYMTIIVLIPRSAAP
jgi:hypothetical protein